MAKIAVELQRALSQRALAGAAGAATPRKLAQGSGWSVADVLCTCGPEDRPFEERHDRVCIAIVAAGTFGYRSGSGRELMTPGSLLLGTPGQCFECGHEHGAGDRCISFQFDPDFFERIAADAGAKPHFGALRLPPLRELSSVVALACAGLAGVEMPWEEISLQVAAAAARLAAPTRSALQQVPATARVAAVVRWIEEQPEGRLSLSDLAGHAGLSPYHFLRVFERVTGVTPHQYLLRLRLRNAAQRLLMDRARILNIALESGFGDLSNFNRSFRAEYGQSPRAYRNGGHS